MNCRLRYVIIVTKIMHEVEKLNNTIDCRKVPTRCFDILNRYLEQFNYEGHMFIQTSIVVLFWMISENHFFLLLKSRAVCSVSSSANLFTEDDISLACRSYGVTPILSFSFSFSFSLNDYWICHLFSFDSFGVCFTFSRIIFGKS